MIRFNFNYLFVDILDNSKQFLAKSFLRGNNSFVRQNSICPRYNQDKVNGLTNNHYNSLFKIIHKINPKSIIDLGGGTGTLALLLQKKFNIYLGEINEEYIAQAIKNGISQDKVLKIDLLSEKSTGKIDFDLAITKSVIHEFPKTKLNQVHRTIFQYIKEGGYYLDFSSHVTNRKIANWLLNWVNMKDQLAGLDTLTQNRYAYTDQEVILSLRDVGFKNITIAHKFYYSLSVKRFSQEYFYNSTYLQSKFYKMSSAHLESLPNQIKYHKSNDDIVVKIPAVILKAQK